MSFGVEESSILIVAFDPGTTNAKIAFLKASEVLSEDGKKTIVDNPHELPIVLEGFPFAHVFYSNTMSTALIYHRDGKLFKWGHEATAFQSEDNFDPELLVTNWKLASRKCSGKQFRDLHAKAQSLGKDPKDFAEDLFRALGQYLLKDDHSCLLNNFGGNLDRFKYIDCVIAVPPGWSRDDHLIFTRAATKGLQLIPNVRIFAASETECALRTWMAQEGNDVMRSTGRAGDTVILLDMGGGTACVSAFCWLSEKWAHLESHSLAAGSEVSTELFSRDFERRLRGVQLVPKMSRLLYEARTDFETIKSRVGHEAEPEYWRCRVRGLMPDRGKRFEKGYMLFTKEEIWSYFEPSQDAFLAKIAEVVSRVTRTHSQPKNLVLTGAYGTNLLFRRKLKKSYNDFDTRIYSPQKRGELVVTGACFARIQGDFRQLTGSRYSAAVSIWLEYKGDVKRENPDAYTFRASNDKKTYCRGLEWIIKKDDRLNDDSEVIADNRKRYIQSTDDLRFDECIYTSEEHPGEEEYTVLKYGVDELGWRQNERDLWARYSMQVTLNEFSLDLRSLQLLVNNRSEITLANSILKSDMSGQFFEYRYFLHLSQTDCRLAIQVFSKWAKSRRIEIQHSISSFDVGSAELEGEYQFVENNRIDSGPDEDLEADVSHASMNVSENHPLAPAINESDHEGYTSLSMFDVPHITTTKKESRDAEPEHRNMARLVMQQASNGQETVSAKGSDVPITTRPKRCHPPNGHFAKYARIQPRAPKTATTTWTDHGGFEDDSDHSEYEEFPRSSRKPARKKKSVQSLKVPVVNANKISKRGTKQRFMKSALI